MNNNFQIIKIDSNLRSFFEKIFLLNKGEVQILTENSKKPLVVHKKTEQITYVYEGCGLVFLNNKKIDINEGNLILISKGTEHSFVCNEGKLNLIHFHYPKDNIEKDIEILLENIKGRK
ncbi:cupin domain-containing protein [Clostridium perfringens]|uniref:cupin domain-containing protein n=1 Tax=Clostridium perfringens TaxID=1502 RepID=UPI0010CE8C45|nr:AraC family ligand binding domain-containing protein [Clostridium perfringens]TBX05620.1 hypothetical protein BFS03_13460 [Clostridium perfringens]